MHTTSVPPPPRGAVVPPRAAWDLPKRPNMLSRLASPPRGPCRRLSALLPLPPNKPLTRTAKAEAAGSSCARPTRSGTCSSAASTWFPRAAALAGMVYPNSAARSASRRRARERAAGRRRAAIHEARGAEARAARAPRDCVTPNARTPLPDARREAAAEADAAAAAAAARVPARSGPTSAAAAAARASARAF